jgi:hypothetical protein
MAMMVLASTKNRLKYPRDNIQIMYYLQEHSYPSSNHISSEVSKPFLHTTLTSGCPYLILHKFQLYLCIFVIYNGL